MEIKKHDISQFLDEMQKIRENILEFLEAKEYFEENFQNLQTILVDLKLYNDHHKLKSLLHLITKISNNHYRFSNFFCKLFQIIHLLSKSIKKYFSNYEIFNIFRDNKRILLYLVEEEIIIMDDHVIKEIVTSYKFKKYKYPQYFAPEIKPYINKNWFQNDEELIKEVNKEIPEDFYELRRIGENENIICKLIQKDLIKEFIIHINKNCISLDMKITSSIYETNCLLYKKNEISLIEYAAFYGSIQIFRYLQIEGVELTPSLWPFAIHGQNAELIHLLEDNHVQSKPYKELLIKSIKYHHNDFAKYFLNNYFTNEDDVDSIVLIKSLKYYNFEFIQYNLLNENSFIFLCRYDYFIIVDILLKHQNIDIKKMFVI